MKYYNKVKGDKSVREELGPVLASDQVDQLI